MKILVLNAGSSSLKYKVIEANSTWSKDSADWVSTSTGESRIPLASGNVERIGTAEARFIHIDAHGKKDSPVKAETASEALEIVLKYLTEDGEVLTSLEEIDAVGHRIAHAGATFNCSVPVDSKVIETIEHFSPLAPLHNPIALEVIHRCHELLKPDVLEVASFDTAFHQTMPERNYVYPIPYRYYEEHGIRRYGFHGISHKYVSRHAAHFLNKSPRDLKMITCHIGAGASLAAIDHGISMDTSMGYTPLDGIMMNTRSGSVDPAIITEIMQMEGLSPAEMDAILNRESGLLGVSGVTGDLRELKEAIRYGQATGERCELAYDIFLTSIRRMIGAYFFELAGVDVIVCTAGVGENDPYARRLIFRGLEPFGICIDQDRNMAMSRTDRRISTDDSSVEVLVVPTDEEDEIARDITLIASGVDISDPYQAY